MCQIRGLLRPTNAAPASAWQRIPVSPFELRCPGACRFFHCPKLPALGSRHRMPLCNPNSTRKMRFDIGFHFGLTDSTNEISPGLLREMLHSSTSYVRIWWPVLAIFSDEGFCPSDT